MTGATLNQEQEFIEITFAMMQVCHALARSKGEWSTEQRFKLTKLDAMQVQFMNIKQATQPCGQLTAKEHAAVARLFVMLLDYCAGFGIRLPLAVIAELNGDIGAQHGNSV